MSVLADRVAIVTGASSGIGEAAALGLAKRGASVVLAARRDDRLHSLAKRVVDEGGDALPVACDVADRSQVERLVRTTLDHFRGRGVDVLINNAGVMPRSQLREARFDDWDAMIDINVKGALYCIGFCLPHMLEQGRGHIVNVSSIAGRFVFPGNTVYCATKHALHVISEGLRQELAQSDPPVTGVRITTIAPGIVDTELPDSSTDPKWRQDTRDYYQTIKNPLTSDDIAQSILYALEAPPHVNVNEIVIRPVEQKR